MVVLGVAAHWEPGGKAYGLREVAPCSSPVSPQPSHPLGYAGCKEQRLYFWDVSFSPGFLPVVQGETKQGQLGPMDSCR